MGLMKCLHCGCIDEKERFFPLDRDEIWQEIEDLYDAGKMDDFEFAAMVEGNDVPGCPEYGMRGEAEEVND